MSKADFHIIEDYNKKLKNKNNWKQTRYYYWITIVNQFNMFCICANPQSPLAWNKCHRRQTASFNSPVTREGGEVNRIITESQPKQRMASIICQHDFFLVCKDIMPLNQINKHNRWHKYFIDRINCVYRLRFHSATLSMWPSLHLALPVQVSYHQMHKS